MHIDIISFDSEYSNNFFLYFRVWVTSKEPDDMSRAQQIGHMNIVPICTDPGGVFTSPKFEPFGDTLDRLNQILKSRPLQGNKVIVFWGRFCVNFNVPSHR